MTFSSVEKGVVRRSNFCVFFLFSSYYYNVIVLKLQKKNHVIHRQQQNKTTVITIIIRFSWQTGFWQGEFHNKNLNMVRNCQLWFSIEKNTNRKESLWAYIKWTKKQQKKRTFLIRTLRRPLSVVNEKHSSQECYLLFDWRWKSTLWLPVWDITFSTVNNFQRYL